MRTTRIAALVVVGLSLAAVAHAQTARAIESAKGYTTQFNLPERRIVTGPADRRVTRIVVPVLAHTFDQFVAHFSEASGGVLFHWVEGNNHIGMVRRPGDLLYWAHQRGHEQGFVDEYGLFTSRGGTGRLIVAQLDPGELRHLNNWLVNPPYQIGAGNCMQWLSNAEVAPGKPIFHALGLTRSKDGPNITKKLLRAANDKVAIVGVKVQSVEQFNAMTDDQLLGPPPSGGIEDSVR
jgi:hypothetical protein